MSYSFTVKAKRADVVQSVDDQLHNVALHQPVHSNDAEAAKQTVENLLQIVDDGESELYQVQVSGSLSCREEGKFTSAHLNVSVTAVKE